MLIKKVNGEWRFFEGRDPRRLGSHVLGRNPGLLGIAVVDNLLNRSPEPELQAAIAKAVAYYQAKYPSITNLMTHGEGTHSVLGHDHTNCGRNLSKTLANIGQALNFEKHPI
jgi:hypothetical protein